jgi:hypothetical protein
MKGILSNRGYKIINWILWIVAILGWFGLLLVTHKLKEDMKVIKTHIIRK